MFFARWPPTVYLERPWILRERRVYPELCHVSSFPLEIFLSHSLIPIARARVVLNNRIENCLMTPLRTCVPPVLKRSSRASCSYCACAECPCLRELSANRVADLGGVAITRVKGALSPRTEATKCHSSRREPRRPLITSMNMASLLLIAKKCCTENRASYVGSL